MATTDPQELALPVTDTGKAGVAPELNWPIKRSFLRYIAAMPDGRCSATDGATLERGEATDAFRFPFAGIIESSAEVTAAFLGDVRFAGHHGLLYIQLTDPALTLAADGTGSLSVTTAPATDPGRVSLATFTLTGSAALPSPGQVSFEATAVQLTAEGAELFGGVYGAGEPFDNFHLTLPALESTTLLADRLNYIHANQPAPRT